MSFFTILFIAWQYRTVALTYVSWWVLYVIIDHLVLYFLKWFFMSFAFFPLLSYFLFSYLLVGVFYIFWIWGLVQYKLLGISSFSYCFWWAEFLKYLWSPVYQSSLLELGLSVSYWRQIDFFPLKSCRYSLFFSFKCLMALPFTCKLYDPLFIYLLVWGKVKIETDFFFVLYPVDPVLFLFFFKPFFPQVFAIARLV